MCLRFIIVLLSLMPTLAYPAVTVTVNGTNHTIPQTNEKGWGANVTAWIQAISANTLQPSGGTFSLTADANFGSSYGLVSGYYKSRTSNISSAGVLRLANSDTIGWRNFANAGDLLLSVDSSDRLLFNGTLFPTLAASDFVDSGFAIVDNGDATKKVAFQVSGVTTATTRTLTVPDVSGTMVLLDATQTLTNKTIAAGSNTITGLVKGDVGLGNVDNTSDATKDAAVATLTNKTLTAPIISTISNTGTITLPTATDTLVARGTTDTLTNKTLTAPVIDTVVLDDQGSTPANPSAGFYKLYAKTDGKVYKLNSSGLESEIGSGSGGGAGINLLAAYNYNAEAGATTNWSETGGGTLSVTSTAADVGAGTYAFSFDASASTDYAISDARTIVAGLYSQRCMAKFRYKGFDADIQAQIYDGTNVVAQETLSAQSTYKTQIINFTCPSSGTLALRFYAGANAAIGYWDDVELGEATNVVEETVTTLPASWTPTITGMGTVTGVDFKWYRDGAYLYGNYSFVAGTTSGTTASFTLPTGLTIDTSVMSGTLKVGTGGANATPFLHNVVVATGSSVSILYFSNSSASVTTGVAGNTWASTTTFTGFFRVPISGWQQKATGIGAAGQPWRVDANISGANPSLGIIAVTSYTGIENGSLTLTNNTSTQMNVLTAQIPCSSTNAPSGTTCSAGNESVGVSFTIPRAGDVLACAEFSWSAVTASSGANVLTSFQIVETPANAQTISQEGKGRTYNSVEQGGTQGIGSGSSIRKCGTFSFTSAGQKTLRLMYEQSVAGTVTQSLIVADASTSNGQRDIHWEVYPIDGTNKTTAMLGLPTVQKFTSGTAQTYTTPPTARALKIKMVGGGGGGGGSGTAGGGNGGNGGDSTFTCGSMVLTAGGGVGGTARGTGGTGGTASLGTGPIGLAQPGSVGGGTSQGASAGGTTFLAGGKGGDAPYFAGGGNSGTGNLAGVAGSTNSGGGGQGGGGGSSTSNSSGGGGGSGGFVEAIITNPSATCTYSVGTSGGAGTAGTNGFVGGAGAIGMIFIEEMY